MCVCTTHTVNGHTNPRPGHGTWTFMRHGQAISRASRVAEHFVWQQTASFSSSRQWTLRNDRVLLPSRVSRPVQACRVDGVMTGGRQCVDVGRVPSRALIVLSKPAIWPSGVPGLQRKFVVRHIHHRLTPVLPPSADTTMPVTRLPVLGGQPDQRRWVDIQLLRISGFASAMPVSQ